MIDESKYIIRKATLEDVDFIASVIIEAEKSSTNNLGLANFFELSEEEIREYIIEILQEEVDGCEFSLSSFFVADYCGEPVSALGGWLEGYYDDMPSAFLKSNLIGYVFPKENVLKTKEKSDIVKEIQIERELGAYQEEYSYTKYEHRGHGLFQRLIKAHNTYAKQLNPNVKKSQVHVFENNESCIRAYQKCGYHIAGRYISHNPLTMQYYPCNVELLLEKEF